MEISEEFGLKSGEYVEGGLIYCERCKQPRLMEIYGQKVRVMCPCEVEEEKNRKEMEQLALKEQRFAELREMSLLGKRYAEVCFEKTEKSGESFEQCLARVKKYCEEFDKNKDGLGLFLYGASGTGKTHLMACMVNYFLKQHKACLFTSFSQISRAIRSGFNGSGGTENEYIKKIVEIPILFVDDIGTENFGKNNGDNFIQQQVYDIVNMRYNKMLPIIFTSNFSMRQLVEERGLERKIVDRIFEMCVPVKIEGSSFRVKKEKNVYF